MPFTLGLGTPDFLKMAKPAAPIGSTSLWGASTAGGTTAPNTAPQPLTAGPSQGWGGYAPKSPSGPTTPTPGPGTPPGPISPMNTSPWSTGLPSLTTGNPLANAGGGAFSPIKMPNMPGPMGGPAGAQAGGKVDWAGMAQSLGQGLPKGPAQIEAKPMPITGGIASPETKNIEVAPGAMPGAGGAQIAPAEGSAPKNIEVAPGALPGAAGAQTAKPQEGAQTVEVAPGALPGAAAGVSGTTLDPTKKTFDQELEEFQKIAAAFAAGQVDDKVFRIAMNRAILQMGLDDQSERDALQMRINQDPSLKGQGAGMALLSMLGAQQGMSADMMFGQLASDSQQRILDMQKYGVEMGVKISQMRRDNALEEVDILIKAGNYNGAAGKLEGVMGLPMGSISAASLQGRDPFMLNQYASQFQQIKDIALSDPAKALALATSFMNNPATKDWFPPGMTAKDLVDSLVSGDFQSKQGLIASLESVINASAKSKAPFLKALDSYRAMGPQAKASFVRQGKEMSLEDINKARAAEGLAAWSKDANGNIIDEKGVAVDDEDFFEAATLADYQRRQGDANRAPWDQQWELIKNSPMFSEVLKLPGGEQAIKNFLIASNLVSFQTDPSTGLLTPVGLMDDPKISFLLHSWPKSAFDENGNPTGDQYAGGDAYGMTLNGEKIMPTPGDEDLNNKYASYLRTAGKEYLNQAQWYYATAGGTKPPDASKIPAGIRPKPVEDHTNVQPGIGVNINIGGSVSGGTTTTPGSSDALAQGMKKVDEMIGRLPAKVDPDKVKSVLEAVAKGTATSSAPGFTTGPGGQIYFGFLALQNMGVPEKDAADLLIAVMGEARFKEAYKAGSKKEWGGIASAAVAAAGAAASVGGTGG